MVKSRILILFGSQTGTAQEIAERIWRESRCFNFQGPILCMDDYDVRNLIDERLVIFVCSTTGQGEEPDNMRKFWKFLLRKNLPSNSLEQLNFAVLGLGDSSYVKFNFVAKRLSRRLCDVGGCKLIDTGLGDDQHDLGCDAVVDPWLENLWSTLSNFYHFPYNVNLTRIEEPKPRWSVQKIEDDNRNDVNLNQQNHYKYTEWEPCTLIVTENNKTTAENHFQDVRLLKLKIPNDFKYNPGDVLMTSPQNSTDQVNLFFKVLNCDRKESEMIQPDNNIKLHIIDNDMPVPRMLSNVVNLRECALKYWDLNAVPRRYAFRILAHVTDNELEKEKLMEFSVAEGQEDLYNYCNRPKRNIIEVLQDFPFATKNISLDYLFEVIQPIRPRAFSIASSYQAHRNELHVLLAVIVFKTKLVKPRIGLCSNYLSNLKPGDVMYGWLKNGSFKFPPPGTPCIMVGPGTGVAPFRSYITELVSLGVADSDKLVLFFGCRNRDGDFHLRQEWEKLVADGKLNMICAFSRDQPDKVYVQHKIAEHGELVWKLIKKDNAYIFIAGSSKNMPQGVKEAFVEVCHKFGRMSYQEAEKFVSSLELCGRYQSETWS